MKKFGLLCVALVLVIGTLGIGYAAWTDTIFVNGTVNTGEVCADFTCPWSQTDPNISPFTNDPWEFTVEQGAPVAALDWVATVDGPGFHLFGNQYKEDKNVGWTEIVCDEGEPPIKRAYLTFHNVYPHYFNHIGLGIHNCGTIPIKMDNVVFKDVTGAQLADPLYSTGYRVFDLSGNGTDDFEVQWGDNFGDQIEPCGSWSIDFWQHVLQDEGIDFETPQTFTFVIEVTVVQWDGYPLPRP